MKYFPNFFIKNDRDNFSSHFKRPKKLENFQINSKDKKFSSRIAIIIQGPISNNSSFITETIKIYKKIFPRSLIVLSTWDDEKAKLSEIKKLKI